jgi:hypothetical protein
LGFSEFMKQSTIEEIIESEKQLVLEAEARYGTYYAHVRDVTIFLSSFLKSIDRSHEFFLRFVSQVKKHHTLAVLSLVRLHKVQAMMNLRQVLEAGACACYAIHNHDHKDFVDDDGKGYLDPTKELTGKRYKWLAEKYPLVSTGIKRKKDVINKCSAHANFIDTTHNFSLSEDESWASAPYFDIADDHLIKTDLWFAASIALELLDMFFGVAADAKGIVFVDDFQDRFNRLVAENNRLCTEMKATDRYKEAMQHPRAQKSQVAK